MTLSPIASYVIHDSASSGRSFRLILARGSVLDFAYPSNPSKSAIVNAANEECLGGGGIDGAISRAGGPNLLSDRRQLPQQQQGMGHNNTVSGVRCPTGKAVITGPNTYGTLAVPYVIHAVGPNYSLSYENDEQERMTIADKLLYSAYTSSLECCQRANLEAVAFCLLSAGVYRGTRTLLDVVRIGLTAISHFNGFHDSFKIVYVCAFTMEEADALVAVANEMNSSGEAAKVPPSNNGDDAVEEISSIDKDNIIDNASKSRTSTSSTDDGKTNPYQPDEQQPRDGQIKQDTREEWEVQRDEMKSIGDSHFRMKSYSLAIQAYQDALQLDPMNHIILSNKSAAHLANGEKSKALHDARKCVEYAASWSKGHTRLAAAMASLGRYNEAVAVYSKVINELEPENAIAIAGLEECRLKLQSAREEKEKEASRLQMELDRQKAEKEEGERQIKQDGVDEEEDLLDDFFSEVDKVSEKPKSVRTNDGSCNNDCTDETNNRIKTQINDLGTSSYQINRLLQINYEWKNLNPFYVLDIPYDIDDDSIITARYRALSLLVHPDKCPDDPIRAKDAFEQVRKAMTHLNDTEKRRHVRALVEQGMKQGKRDWEAAKKTNGNSIACSASYDEDALAQAQNKATMKIFAEIEQSRRNIERRKREYEKRERSQEDDEKAKEKNEREYDKRWREGERVEKRIGNWRNFQSGGEMTKKGRLN